MALYMGLPWCSVQKIFKEHILGVMDAHATVQG